VPNFPANGPLMIRAWSPSWSDVCISASMTKWGAPVCRERCPSTPDESYGRHSKPGGRPRAARPPLMALRRLDRLATSTKVTSSFS
jgi:hypothetical protein